MSTFLDQGCEDSVYWVERGGRDETQYSLHAAPVNVADRLRPLLFGPGKTIVLTSATLGVGDPKLGYFRGRVDEYLLTLELSAERLVRHLNSLRR